MANTNKHKKQTLTNKGEHKQRQTNANKERQSGERHTQRGKETKNQRNTEPDRRHDNTKQHKQ